MPELPDLEIVREFLTPRIVGVPISAVQVLRPIIFRNLMGGELADHLLGRAFAEVTRRDKFLLFPIEDGPTLVINPMLAGRLRYGEPLKRYRKRDALAIRFDDGQELLYNDAKDMGKIYLTDDLSQVPTLSDLGPEATDLELTLDAFAERLHKRRGEIKGVLVNQGFVAGIGNAYADEILWRAHLYPFRRSTDLSPQEVEALYQAMREVLQEAIATLRERVGADIEVEIRDFMAVHGKAGQPCPRCGGVISEVKRERRVTDFCRTCQPGLMVGPGRSLPGERTS